MRGGHAVDLIGEQKLGEDRALVQGEFAGLGREDRGAEDVGGHHVGGALNAAEVQRQEAGKRFDSERLGNAGDPFHQGMTAAEQGEKRLVDKLPLAGDDAAYLGSALLEDLKGGLDVLLGC